MKQKLIIFDMDGVLFEHTNFWLELHRKLGTYDEGKQLTEKYVKTDYAKLVDEVVGRLWKGKPAEPYFELINEARYVKGAGEAINQLKLHGYTIAIISGGPKDLALRAQRELGIDQIYTNELVVEEGIITGKFFWPIAHDRKAVMMRKLAEDNGLHLGEVIVVGDSAGDVKMMRLAGLGIAFCTHSEELKKVATAVVENLDLREILPYVDDFEKRQALKIT
jgi:phosphoserine phosphatase